MESTEVQQNVSLRAREYTINSFLGSKQNRQNKTDCPPFVPGAQYFDNTSLKEKEDDVVPPGGEHTYYWEVTANVAPQKDDPSCLTYTYVSHLNVVRDYNSGLIGALLLCKPGNPGPRRGAIGSGRPVTRPGTTLV